MSEANLETRVAILETHVENQRDTLNRIETKLETVFQTLNDTARDFNGRLNDMSKDFNGKLNDMSENFNGRLNDMSKDFNGKLNDLNDRMWHLIWQLPIGIAAIAGTTVTVLEVIL